VAHARHTYCVTRGLVLDANWERAALFTMRRNTDNAQVIVRTLTEDIVRQGKRPSSAKARGPRP
jgi:hypothetical protein